MIEKPWKLQVTWYPDGQYKLDFTCPLEPGVRAEDMDVGKARHRAGEILADVGANEMLVNAAAPYRKNRHLHVVRGPDEA